MLAEDAKLGIYVLRRLSMMGIATQLPIRWCALILSNLLGPQQS
jgi:hypothetical protein